MKDASLYSSSYCNGIVSSSPSHVMLSLEPMVYVGTLSYSPTSLNFSGFTKFMACDMDKMIGRTVSVRDEASINILGKRRKLDRVKVD